MLIKSKRLEEWMKEFHHNDSPIMWFYDDWKWNEEQEPHIFLLDRSGGSVFYWNFIKGNNSEGKWVGEYGGSVNLTISKGVKKNTILVCLSFEDLETGEKHEFFKTVKLFKISTNRSPTFNFCEEIEEILERTKNEKNIKQVFQSKEKEKVFSEVSPKQEQQHLLKISTQMLESDNSLLREKTPWEMLNKLKPKTISWYFFLFLLMLLLGFFIWYKIH